MKRNGPPLSAPSNTGRDPLAGGRRDARPAPGGSAALRVTDLRADPHDAALVFVLLSDGRRLRLDAGTLSELQLVVGMELDQRLESLLALEAERGAARARALRYLETRERSRFEVGERLRRFGYGEPLVGETLDWLLALGYLDDRRFAEWFARAHARSAWGPRRFREELRRKGISKAIIEETLAPLDDPGRNAEAELEELATQLGRRFRRELAGDRERAERRITGYLGRRGHDWETIRRVLARLVPPDPGDADVDNEAPAP